MPLQVLTRAKETNLIELATVKSRLEIDSSDTSKDVYLAGLIEDASGAVVDFCNRPFARQKYAETLRLDGTQYLLLSRWPIESFTDPVVDGFSLTGAVVSEEEDGMLFRQDRWTGLSSAINFSVFPAAARQASIWADVDPYVAGHIVPGQDAAWVASTVKVVGDIVKSSDASVELRFECTVAGTTDTVEPVWPTVVDDVIVDGGVTWSAKPVFFLPKTVIRAVWETVHGYWNTDFRDVEILQRRISEQDWMEYARQRGDIQLPVLARGLLKNYRRVA